MTVKDMHIQVEQGIQKVFANRTRKFLYEEIDLALNKVMNRFIQSKVKPRKDGSGGFEVDQLDVDSVRNLIVSNRVLPAYVTTSNRYVCYLPSDYTHLLSDSSNATDLCGLVAEELPVVTLSVVKIRQDKTVKVSSPFYVTVQVTLSDKTVAIPGDLPYNNTYGGYPMRQDVNFITPFILQTFRRAGYEVYWEKFDDIYIPSTYILVVATNAAVPSAMLIDGNAGTPGTSLTRVMVQHKGDGPLVSNRLTASSVIPDLLSTAFYKTSNKSPISELVGTNLYIYNDVSFIVNKVNVSYLRKPQSISLLLGTDCEVSEDFHDALCDLTVEHLKGVLENATGAAISESDISRRVTL